jgi:hypothetical protein
LQWKDINFEQATLTIERCVVGRFEVETKTRGIFTESLYERFRHFLQPATHSVEKGIELAYTPE